MKQTYSDCATFADLVNEVLDRVRPIATLNDHPHPLHCSTCQDAADAAKMLVAVEWPTPAVPAGFADHVLARTRQSIAIRQQRWRTTVAVLASLAASVAVIALALPTPRRTESAVAKVAAPRIDESLMQARTALVSLTKRTAGESILPATRLFTPVASAPASPPVKPHDVQLTPPPPTAFAPVANTTTRAIDLFVRDLGGFAGLPKGNL
jgi:hypothetical protein